MLVSFDDDEWGKIMGVFTLLYHRLGHHTLVRDDELYRYKKSCILGFLHFSSLRFLYFLIRSRKRTFIE